MVQWGKLFSFGEGMNVHRFAEEARRLIPVDEEESLPSALDPMEVTKVALRLRFLIEECVPCQLEEEKITRPHSKIITDKVVRAAKDAGDDEYGACVVYCLLINKKWFKQQALIEIWDADLHNLRAVASEVIAKAIIEGEERMDYLMHKVLLQRYATLVNGEPTNVANAIERAVDMHALRVIGSSGYQKTVQYLWKGWLVQANDDPTKFVDYTEKADTRYWVHVDPDRMRAPVYQNTMEILFSLIYLGLYTAAINTVNTTGDLDVVEGLLYLFTFGFICDEVSKIWKVGRYYVGFWNVFNLLLHGLLTTSFILRLIALAHPLDSNERAKYNELSYNFLAFSAPMFWLRLLLFLDTFRFFGAMLVILKVMMKESLIFFALLIVVIIGFLQAFIGMDAADNHTDATFFILQAMSNAVMQAPDFSGFDGFAPPFGIILYYVFTFVVMVILLNILIALYNSAYQDITDNALDEYMALFAQKTMQFVRPPDENVFIAPFNLVEIFCLIIPFEWWMSAKMYSRLNDYVMTFLYSPLLLIAAYFETRSAQAVTSNRKRGELDDDTVEEWEQLTDKVDFEAEGWTKKVDSAKSNVEDSQATLEVRELRGEVQELKEMLRSLLKEKQRASDDSKAGKENGTS